jgi:hypothetical protein
MIDKTSCKINRVKTLLRHKQDARAKVEARVAKTILASS